ncbi:MAG: preprotein translocase subunit SecE [Acidobacteriota bacterium]
MPALPSVVRLRAIADLPEDSARIPGSSMLNKIKYFFQEFLPEVKAEWKKVTKPNRNEVVSTTIVVVVTSVIFAFYLWAADWVIQTVYSFAF